MSDASVVCPECHQIPFGNKMAAKHWPTPATNVPLSFLGALEGCFSGALKPVCICATSASSFSPTYPLTCPCYPQEGLLEWPHLTAAIASARTTPDASKIFHSPEAWFLTKQVKDQQPCSGLCFVSLTLKQLCLDTESHVS